MQIKLTDTGKRFNREWIFRGLSYEFNAPKKYAITGPNGSGKSTLLQIIAGVMTCSEGTIIINNQQETRNRNRETRNKKQEETIFQNISISTPYMELVEEMTANEFLSFHAFFKPLSVNNDQALNIVGLGQAAHKQIRYFSSGMKQRLKLAQAFFCKSPVLLLDEPATNLDTEGITLYHQLIKDHASNKLVIISSNDRQEYSFCDEVIEIGKYKAI